MFIMLFGCVESITVYYEPTNWILLTCSMKPTKDINEYLLLSFSLLFQWNRRRRFMNTLFQNKQAMNKTKQTCLAGRREKRPFFTMWSLKSRDFKDRCHGLNYFQGFNNSLRPCHLHHGRRPTKQKALKAMFNGTALGTKIYRYYVGWRNKETAYFQFT